MTKRPLFSKSVHELEALSAKADGDLASLREILEELDFRTTAAATKLRTSLVRRIASSTNKSATAPATAPPTGPSANQADSKATTDLTASGSSSQNEGCRFAAPKTKPPVTDKPIHVLEAWTALEVLSPQGYRRETQLTPGNPNDIVPLFPNGPMPWELGVKSRPGKKLLFEIVLGTLSLGPAVASLLKVYSDRRPEFPSRSDTAVLATIIVDKEGRPFEEESSLIVSSFAWGVPIALLGDLTALAKWPEEERTIRRDLHRQLFNRLPSGEVAPLDFPTIRLAFHSLARRLNLQGQETREPHFAIRRYEFFASKLPSEPTTILNSFFLRDLDLARSLFISGKAPETLNLYLGQSHPQSRKDLLDDKDALREILAPRNTPQARWPSSRGHALAILQQAAVNGTTKQKEGILSVNGPPGTGKTTLLRDIIAARIVERAEAMSRFDDPARAFKATNEHVQRRGAKLTFHRVDPSLRGHEMVVASSNNRAVENVSAELPTLAAVGGDAAEARYFPSLADHVLGNQNWGMIAAVLGNSSNRYHFSERFWKDEEKGLSTYLNHASGTPQFSLDKNASGAIEKRFRDVVLLEDPPAGKQEARQRWIAARKNFLAIQESVRSLFSERDEVHQALLEIPPIIEILGNLRSRCLSAKEESRAAEDHRLKAAAEHSNAVEGHQGAMRQLSAHRKNRPGLFAMLFNSGAAKDWKTKNKLLSTALDLANRQLREAEDHLREHTSKAAEITNREKILRTQLSAKQSDLAQIQGRVDLTKQSGAVVPDDEYFSLDREAREIASVWLTPDEQKLREDLFSAAVNLHRAFIDAAADPIRQNLGIFMDSFGTRSFGTAAKDLLTEDLWATFFLVVPVVSTTFASMERMFAQVSQDAIGWLLVDEGGQASPQSAVGGLLRARRSVIVGDPLQIEPVVVLPNVLTEEICGQFAISPLKYNAPESSVQTLGDAASPQCGRFPTGSGWREVGSPLLVHRRCDSPMFEISNSIAYANLMVGAKPPPSASPPLGASRWIDVREGSTFDKWSEDEGIEVMKLLKQLRTMGGKLDLYIIAPFVIVQDRLRTMLSQSGILKGWADDPDTWSYQNIGTVHTVQGREAATVIFVLGAPSASQQGARSWAGGTPNLLNVAVTRAKSALYVVGNRQLWAEAGVFRELHNLIN